MARTRNTFLRFNSCQKWEKLFTLSGSWICYELNESANNEAIAGMGNNAYQGIVHFDCERFISNKKT
jgi:hypothetical protein